MQNTDHWTPTKYIWRKGRLVGSRDPRELSPASRLAADLVASHYQATLGKFAKGRLLDLGCGNVPLYGAYRDFVSEAVCVDWANSPHKNEFLDLQCDLTQPLPFGDGEFDTIVLSDVLEHVSEPAALFAEMHRVLAPQGHVFVNVPFFYWLHEEPHDYYRFTEFGLRRLATMAGFHCTLLEKIGGAPEILADILSKNLVGLPAIGVSMAELVQALAALWLKTGYGRRISQATSAKFPLGYFLVAAKNG